MNSVNRQAEVTATVMKDIVRIIIRIALLAVVLLLVTRQFKKADEKVILSPVKSFYSAWKCSRYSKDSHY